MIIFRKHLFLEYFGVYSTEKRAREHERERGTSMNYKRDLKMVLVETVLVE